MDKGAIINIKKGKVQWSKGTSILTGETYSNQKIDHIQHHAGWWWKEVDETNKLQPNSNTNKNSEDAERKLLQSSGISWNNENIQGKNDKI